MVDPTVLDRFLDALQVYGQVYGTPPTPEQRRGIAATVLHLIQEHSAKPLRPGQVIYLLAQGASVWGDDPPAATILGEAAALLGETGTPPHPADLAQMAHRWHSQLQQHIQETLIGYVQHHGPLADTPRLRETVLSLIPLLADRILTPAEVNGILREAIDRFDLETALAAPVNPAVLELVKQLVTVLRQKPLEAAVRDTVTAYAASIAPALVSLGEDLVERALRAVLKNQIDFGLDVDLALLDQQLLIRQVHFQVNVMESSPPPSKTAQRMAAELRAAIEGLPNRPGSLDIATGKWDGDLSVSSPFTSRCVPPSDEPGADNSNPGEIPDLGADPGLE